VLWFLVLGAIPVVSHYDPPAWDLSIYRHALQSVQAGHDPYADAIAAQEAVHRLAPGVPTPYGPFSYVYSPITLPLLRFFGWLPLWAGGSLFWLLYAAGVAVQSRFGLGLMSESERRILQFYAPAAIFFPGFLGSDIVMSGNVVFILYGAALVCVGRALRTGSWRWFYAVVLIASCFKAPLLTLLAIPVLCARKQWLAAIGTGAAGLGLFAVQRLLWPQLFHNFLTAVDLQFIFNRDFGFSPAGLFSGWLFDHHLPYYSAAGMIFYLAYAVPVFAALLYLSRRYLRGEFTAREWMPVMLIGVILLNPRLMEYDAAPLALPVALVCWRFFSGVKRSVVATLAPVAGIFLAVNLWAGGNWNRWKLTEGPLMVAFLLGGMATLVRLKETEHDAIDVPGVLTEA
jgi:hypothetical protein